MKKISYLFFSVILGCSSLLSQSNNIETQITLPAAIEQALKNNPRIWIFFDIFEGFRAI